MSNTGIALFVYNRPDHTRRVLESLRENDIEHLYIFADGPKPSDDPSQIEDVREVIHDVDWCDTEIVEREENAGMVGTTIDGIHHVLDRHERIIVFEDDNVAAPDFVDYCETCLDAYADNDRVMSISGYNPPISIPRTYRYDVYFTYRMGSWGWATWRDAWEKFEINRDDLGKRIKQNAEEVERVIKKAGRDLFPRLKRQVEGAEDSWSVWWCWCIAKHDGLCVNPVESRIKNIGHDGSGAHGVSTDLYEVTLTDRAASETLSLPEEPFVHWRLNRRYVKYNDRSYLTRRAKQKLQTIVEKLTP